MSATACPLGLEPGEEAVGDIQESDFSGVQKPDGGKRGVDGRRGSAESVCRQLSTEVCLRREKER